MIMAVLQKVSQLNSLGLNRIFSVSQSRSITHQCKLLIIGGGTGGCVIANKLAKVLKKDEIIILEPSKVHYYQPLWTLVGAGIKTLDSTRRDERSLIPSKVKWLTDEADMIDPDKNSVSTVAGDIVQYEFLLVATGLEIDYDRIPGLREALADKGSGVSTIYSAAHCEKTWTDLRRFNKGEAIFTYPDTCIKCPGAPQKIAYLAEDYFTRTNVRSKAHISFHTSLPVIFGVPKYAEQLVRIAARKRVDVRYRRVLQAVHGDRREAVFHDAVADKTETLPFTLLHVGPPMRTARALRAGPLADAAGLLPVDRATLRHIDYGNVFGIGDCTNTPNSKTAAAIAKQGPVVAHNLLAAMRGAAGDRRYDGYGACPLVTARGRCLLAEFLYDGVVHETFPFIQGESRMAYYMKKDLFPFIYWNFMMKGNYDGPEFIRKMFTRAA